MASTTTMVEQELTVTTEVVVTTTTTIETSTAPDAQDQSPESWTQALLAAANQDDFESMDSYAFVSEEKRDLFRTFVEFDLPQLASASSCGGDGASVGCPISFDDTQSYMVTFNSDNGDLKFADLIVRPEILDSIAPDGAIGSGCSPGPGPLPDGEWLGDIAERGSDEIEFDLICLIPNENADWEPINEITELRTVPVDPNLLVMDLSQFDLIPSGTTYDNWGTEPCDVDPCAVWLSLRDGRVRYISEQFLS